MRLLSYRWAACVLAAGSVASRAGAQQTPASSTPSSTRAADSAARDSIALVRELEKMQGAARSDTGGTTSNAVPSSGPTNPRLLPDFSAVGDLVGDLSPKGSTQADKSRFGVREVEIAVQAAVDPYFRGDVFLGISDAEKISIEQAYLTTTSLPHGLEARLGRFLMPVGKENTTHRHDLHTIEYPYVIQKYLSDDGLKGTGISLSKIFSPFGFYQELQLTAVDRFGDRADSLNALEPANKQLGNLGYSARLRNYIDINESTNFELSASAITGKREQPLTPGFTNTVSGDLVNAVNARQTVVGADLTYRWRPLQQGLYKSFLLQAEFLRQINETNVDMPTGQTYSGPARNYSGGYAFARYQITTRGFLGVRYDGLQDPDALGKYTQAGSGYFEFFPSEFSKLVASYERYVPPASLAPAVNRILVQAVFSLGPHKPHPF
jgi:hypothetical protein